MKKSIITIALAVLFINAANGYCQKSKSLVDIPGKGRIERAGKKGNESLRFYNEKGKLIKAISLKSDTVKTGKGLRVTECVGTKAAATGCYIGVSRFRYNPALENLGGSSLESWTEYYNPRGKLMWRKECSGSEVSADGSWVVLKISIWSPQAKEYDYAQYEDPKHRDRIIVVDSLGRETFRYEADSTRGYSYGGFHISNDIIFADLAYYPDTSIKYYKDQHLDFTKILSIKYKKAHTVPHDTAVKYDYGVDKDYNVVYVLKEDIIKGVTPFRRVIPLEEW